MKKKHIFKNVLFINTANSHTSEFTFKEYVDKLS